MAVTWTKMAGVLKPKVGDNFALIFDFLENNILLIDLKRGRIVMSDSGYLQKLYAPVVEAAHGDVLLLGFGMGFTLLPIMNKPEVTSVTVVEREQEILDLCASQLKLNDKVRITLDDAITYEPDMMFDLINDDCDYEPIEFKFDPYSYNKERLKQWLKPDGMFMMNWGRNV